MTTHYSLDETWFHGFIGQHADDKIGVQILYAAALIAEAINRHSQAIKDAGDMIGINMPDMEDLKNEK